MRFVCSVVDRKSENGLLEDDIKLQVFGLSRQW